MSKRIGGIGPLGSAYRTTGPLEDKTDKLESWLRWVDSAMKEFAAKPDAESQATARGLKIAIARFIAEFTEEKHL